MQILITYATNSSGTYEVGKLIRQVAISKGHDVNLLSVTQTSKDNIDKAELVFIGSNTWDGKGKDGKVLEGQLPPHFQDFKSSLKGATFKDKKCAVFGLGDSHYTFVCASAEHLKKFVEEIDGRLISVPLKIENYLFDMEDKNHGIITWATGVLKEAA